MGNAFKHFAHHEKRGYRMMGDWVKAHASRHQVSSGMRKVANTAEYLQPIGAIIGGLVGGPAGAAIGAEGVHVTAETLHDAHKGVRAIENHAEQAHHHVTGLVNTVRATRGEVRSVKARAQQRLRQAADNRMAEAGY